jgi:predicted nucleotidyltransferase
MHPLIETHHADLLALARSRDGTSIRVFGSMSRNGSTESSDEDLLVTLGAGDRRPHAWRSRAKLQPASAAAQHQGRVSRHGLRCWWRSGLVFG